MEEGAEAGAAVDTSRFLELSAASLSLAGLSACVKQPREGIVPYVNQPEEVVPGRPLFFATAATLGGYATGLLVESHTGRPTKVEGNPDHPASLGATDAYAQALVLSLYDPDRSQTISRLGQIRTWANFTDELGQRVKIHAPSRATGSILTQTVTSPTLAAQLRAVLAALPKARWHQWEPAGRDEVRAGARLAYGQAVETRHDFSKADVVLTLDADPFVSGPGAIPAARAFARRRREAAETGGAAPRYYAVESTPTASSSLADHRFPVKPSALASVARSLHGALAGGPADPAFPWLGAAAADLRSAGARGLVVAGDYAPGKCTRSATRAAAGAERAERPSSSPSPWRPSPSTSSRPFATSSPTSGRAASTRSSSSAATPSSTPQPTSASRSPSSAPRSARTSPSTRTRRARIARGT